MIIWNYFFKQFVKNVFLILFLALSLFFLITYIEDSQHFFDGYPDVSYKTMFFYYFWEVPIVFVQLLPFCVLFAAIIVNWSFAKSGEISALRASGMSMLRICAPFIFAGMMFTILHFVFDEFVIPVASQKFNYIRDVEIRGRKDLDLFVRSHWIKSNGGVLHFSNYDEKNGLLISPRYFKYSENGHQLNLYAYSEYGQFDSSKKIWVLKQSDTFDFSSKFLLVKKTNVEFETDVTAQPPKVLRTNSDASQVGFFALYKIISQAQKAGSSVSDRLIDLYMKTSKPFASFLFVFLALPFAIRKERQDENYFGILICFSFAVVYWFGMVSAYGLALKGILSPFLAAWLFNVILMMIIYFILYRLDKAR